MKRIALYICIVIFAAGAVMAGGYQGAKWGMSPEEVVAAFPDAKWYYKKAKRGKSYCTGELLDMKISREFYFSEKKLYKVAITPLDEFGIRKKYVAAIPKLRQAMRDKYGPPAGCFQGNLKHENQVECIKPGEMRPDQINSILAAKTEYREYWNTDYTLIALQFKMRALTGGTLVYDSMILYIDVNYKPPKADVSSNIHDEI